MRIFVEACGMLASANMGIVHRTAYNPMEGARDSCSLLIPLVGSSLAVKFSAASAVDCGPLSRRRMKGQRLCLREERRRLCETASTPALRWWDWMLNLLLLLIFGGDVDFYLVLLSMPVVEANFFDPVVVIA